MLQVYKSVEDIDLFTGGLCETPLQGGIIGPTFGCVIGLQFSFLRKCDRFWLVFAPGFSYGTNEGKMYSME